MREQVGGPLGRPPHPPTRKGAARHGARRTASTAWAGTVEKERERSMTGVAPLSDFYSFCIFLFLIFEAARFSYLNGLFKQFYKILKNSCGLHMS